MPVHNKDCYSGPAATRKILFNDEERRKLKEAILEAVHQDPLVRDTVDINVTFPADDEKGIVLEGKVSDERQKDRRKGITMNRSLTDVKIYDSLIVVA